MKKKLLALSVLLGMVFLFQCKAPQMISTPNESVLQVAKKMFPEITLVDLTKGHELYTTKCAKCHDAKNPVKFSAEEWPKILSKMAPKAKLTEEEKAWVNQYFLTARETSK